MAFESKSKKNPILVAPSISKLVLKIKRGNVSTAEIKYLKDRCIIDDDISISLAASKALVLLVECGVLQTTSLLSELISSLTLVKCYRGIADAICRLLFLDLQLRLKEDVNFKCVYNLRAPQHPLISLFIRDNDICSEILTKIKYHYLTDYYEVAPFANEQFFPFYMYVLCNPTTDVPDHFYYELWNFIVIYQDKQSLNLMIHGIIWLQSLTEKQALRASKVLMMLVEKFLLDNRIGDTLFLLLTSIIYDFIELGLDPSEIVLFLAANVQKINDIKAVSSCMLTLLVHSIPLSSSNYLEDIMKLCSMVLKLGHCNKFSQHFLKASILQWMAYGCFLTSSFLVIANQILLDLKESGSNYNTWTTGLLKNETFLHIKRTNSHIHASVELNVFSETIHLQGVSEFLNRLDGAPVHILKKFYNYFLALFLYTDLHYEETLKVINFLHQISSFFKETTTQLLTLFLYKLSNETEPKLHFALFKALPQMAVLKENLPLVLNTFESIRKNMIGLKSFVLTLFYELWSTNEKCYAYLQNVLASTEVKYLEGAQLQQFYLTKASVIKKICYKRPELHGTELVSHLSEVLNKCSDDDGGAATALAIDAIKGLCKAGIVDMNSTWRQLFPQFRTEKRLIVLKSFCGFMAEASYFAPAECSEVVTDEILKTLWNYGINSNETEVVVAAYNALACFTLEQVSLHYPDEIKAFYPNMQNTLSFNLIPGRFWINLLLYIKESTLKAAGELLSKLVIAEISTYRSSTYHVADGQREPQSLAYLPEQSIIRALEYYIRSQIGNFQKSKSKLVYIECLHILSQEYVKPLPPVDWCFLQELIHIPETRFYCIAIASHQVQISGTARRLIENFITGLSNVSEQVDDVKSIYSNLKYLCNSIQPMTLRPFVEASMKYALQKAQAEENLELFEVILMHLTNTLKDENLQDVNRHTLSGVIVNTVQQLDVINPLVSKVIESIIALPIRYIDELSSPKLWKFYSKTQVNIWIKVRYSLILKAVVSPLTWFDDILDTDMEILHDSLFCNSLIEVLQAHRNAEFASSWISELLSNIHSKIANTFMTKQHLKFLCDVFILSVVILSGNDLFLQASAELLTREKLRLLPQSIVHLIKLPHWQGHTTQIAEWLHHMINNDLTLECYKFAFLESLAALKHEEVFQKTSKWMSYVGLLVG